jgi:hypothetical protein
MSTLALTSNTLAVTAGSGQLEYNGQFFATDSNASRGQLERITQGTAVASTSGTSIDFTGIPAWAKKIIVMFNGVSTNGASNYQVQIGSGSVVTTGYVASASGSTVTTTSTTGFIFNNSLSAGTAVVGSVTLVLFSGNTWIETGISCSGGGNFVSSSTGFLTLSGVLDRLRITTVNGTDTFDAGLINIMYEG